jgi:fatty-acyl-CoA synthase
MSLNAVPASRMISGLADIEAMEGQGAAPLPQSTYDVIAASAQRQPSAKALSFFLTVDEHHRPEVWTYQRLFHGITATANFFHSLGIRKGDVVAYVLPNLPETHLTLWGGQAAGIVFAVNPLLEAQAIAELLRAAQTRVLVTLAPFPGTDLWQKLQTAIADVPTIKHVVLVNLADHVAGLKRLPARWLQRREERRLHGRGGVRGAVPVGVRVHDFNKSITAQESRRLISGRQPAADDVSSYFCTGGTTGLPKIAVRTHGNEVANAWSAGSFLGNGIDASKTVFCGLPLFHVNAVLVTGLVAFSRGAHVVLGTPQGYRGAGVVARFWEIVERHRINFFSGVPTLYASLLEHPLSGRDVSSLEFGLCGAAPLPMELMRSFQAKTGLKILEGYGLTEGTCVSSCNPPGGDRPVGSIGLRVPNQLMKAVLLDEQGKYVRDCMPGEVGLLAISGANVFQGYKDEKHNEGIWIDMGDGRRWLNTGDLGRQDENGFFFLTGRKKELIIRGGHNLDPASIEEPLHRHPAIQIAAAVGRPDAHAGEVPVAYVQLKAGQIVSTDELLDFAKLNIKERAATPKTIRIIEAMPLTAVGKVFKPELKYREIASALTAALEEENIAVVRLEAMADPRLGTSIKIELADRAKQADAEAVLGRFPFAWSFS